MEDFVHLGSKFLSFRINHLQKDIMLCMKSNIKHKIISLEKLADNLSDGSRP